jgi:D-alanyl-D-alanine carboxypeptidase/D-alanyl-D-alanine-endopeptidase (penicillin-binding protein 4)
MRNLCLFDASARCALPKAVLVALLVAAMAAPAVARARPKHPKQPAPPKQETVLSDSARIESAGFAAQDVGYLVVDLSDKRVLAESNPDQLFIPASVSKLATIIPALEVLGSDHRFTTTIEAQGNVAEGVLTGSLILKGGGDPSLTGDDLQTMAKQLAGSGIKRVDGTFAYDATATINLPFISAMQPEAADYNCGVSALSVNYNRIHLEWHPDGTDRIITATAVSDNLKLPLNDVSLSFASDKLPGPYLRTGPAGEDRWQLSANLPAKGEVWLPLADPAPIAADIFRSTAGTVGVVLPPAAPGVAAADVRTLVTHESRPLSDIARYVLRYSNNLSTELIGLATSKALTGQRLPLEDSAAALVTWWRQHVPAANWTGLVLGNHSGLSSESRTTPRQIVAMLEEASGQSAVDFHDLLHQIGWKGVKGSAYVKTGTMEYVRGLAGYIDTAAGHRLVFALFFNDPAKRAALTAAFDPRIVAIDARSRIWRNRAIELERKLTSGWSARF